MKADRKVEIFGRGPERLVALLMDHLVAVGVGPDEAGVHAQLLFGETHLGDRELDRLQWQHRHPEEPVGIRFAVIGEPAIVGAAGRRRELGVVDRTREQPEARIQKRRVDAVGIHVGDAGMRVEPAGLAVLIRHRVGLDHALSRPDCADPADAEPAVADRVLLDDEAFLAVLALDDARRPVAEFRVDVLVPQIERLEDVAVGVDDVVLVAHNRFPPNQTRSIRPRARAPNDRLVAKARYPGDYDLSKPPAPAANGSAAIPLDLPRRLGRAACGGAAARPASASEVNWPATSPMPRRPCGSYHL